MPPRNPTQSRNANPGQLALPGLPAPPGARHGRPDAPTRGGGSPVNCKGSKVAIQRGAAAPAAEDPRIADLRRMGLNAVWCDVAASIGFEAFVETWRILANSESVLDDRMRIAVPSFSNFLRYQRNELIRSLVGAGFGLSEIQTALAKRRENITPNRLKKLIGTL